MQEDRESSVLTLLEESSGRGEFTVVLHLFAGDRKIGRAVLCQNGVLQSSDLSPNLCMTLQSHANSKLTEFGGPRVFEFLLDYCETAIRVVGEILEAPAQLVVFGAGHVGQAVAIIGALAGYNVVIMDDRSEFLTRERFPNRAIKLVNEKYNLIGSHIRITKNTAVVIVTRGHQFDEICLEQVLEAGAKYVGMIGSRRRVLSIFKRLEASGISRSVLESVHAPIGLKIGAVSPQEIAVAILAEIISVMNGYSSDHIVGRRRQL